MLPPNFAVVNVEQGSPEWFAARAGRVTSSEAEKLFKEGKKKGEPSVMKRDYRIRLANEQLIGRSLDDGDTWKGKFVERGKRLEHEARTAYEMKTGRLVQQAGFIAGKDKMVGSSIDGYVGDFLRVLELKVPKPNTHMEYWKDKGQLVKDYVYQGTMHFHCTGAQVVDYVSFCPDVPEAIQLLIVTVQRPPLEAMQSFGQALDTFLEEVAQEVREVQSLVAAVEADALLGVTL